MTPRVLWHVLVLLLFAACSSAPPESDTAADYRQEMRDFVIGLSAYAKKAHPGFAIVPQNGHPLLTKTGEPGGAPAEAYLNALDGVGQESLNFGHGFPDHVVPVNDGAWLAALVSVAKTRGKAVLITDYTRSPEQAAESRRRNAAAGFLSMAADSKILDRVPGYPGMPYGAHAGDISSISDARNYLYLINPERYATKAEFLAALRETDYDLLILDAFFREGDPLSGAEIASLGRKARGGKRLVLAYMSIGEAEDYRFYWKPEYKTRRPPWLEPENPDWPGNYKVRYWRRDWKGIIYGNPGAYLDRILAAGFDGAYLDIIDAFEYFEQKPK